MSPDRDRSSASAPASSAATRPAVGVGAPPESAGSPAEHRHTDAAAAPEAGVHGQAEPLPSAEHEAEREDASAAHHPGEGEPGAAAAEAGPEAAEPSAGEPQAGEAQAAEAVASAGEAAEAGEAEPGEAADHEAQLEHDLEELARKASKADEYLELAQRTKADFENYRRRAAREAAAAQERGVAKLALELLPAVDNLDRALAATNGVEDADTLVSGIKLVHADVIAALARVGIEPYSPEGERFDPQHHEAVAQQPVDGAESGTIVEVYQRGYRLGDSILRPARVVVAA